MKKKEASLFCLLEVKKKSKHLSWIERKMYKRLLPYYTHYTDEVYKARDRKAEPMMEPYLRQKKEEL